MTDFFGNEYVGSRMTRFKYFPELWGFNERRANAVKLFIENIVLRLRGHYGKQTTSLSWLNPAGSWANPSDINACIRVPEIAPDPEMFCLLNAGHYDSFTKGTQEPQNKQPDPAAKVLANLQYQKWLASVAGE